MDSRLFICLLIDPRRKGFYIYITGKDSDLIFKMYARINLYTYIVEYIE